MSISTVWNKSLGAIGKLVDIADGTLDIGNNVVTVGKLKSDDWISDVQFKRTMVRKAKETLLIAIASGNEADIETALTQLETLIKRFDDADTPSAPTIDHSFKLPEPPKPEPKNEEAK